MNKKIIIIILILSSLPFISAVLCNDITEQEDIPCEVQTGLLNCSNNAIIINTNNESLNWTEPMTLINPICTESCIYNFSFSNTNISNYEIDLCDNRTIGIIRVVEQRTTINTVTGNPTSWIAKDFVLPSGFSDMTVRSQIKYLAKGLFDWFKEILFMYWWLIMIIFILLLIWLKKTKKLKKNGLEEVIR